MSSCSACDHARLILCLDCYKRADDERLPMPYSEYVRRAAGYPVRTARRTPVAVVLMAVLAAGGVLAAVTASETHNRVRRQVAAIRAKTDVLNGTFVQLREAQACAQNALKADFLEELERAARNEQSTACPPFAHP